MKNLALILLILICTSCGTTKEMRRSNRAAKKLERLVEKFPELKRTDTVLTAISMKTPQIKGTIIQPIFVPGIKEFITLPGKPIFIPGEVDPFSIPFNDNVIDALFSYNGIDFLLDYTIKPIAVDTTIKTITSTIQPTVYKPLPLKWWQRALMWLGVLLILLIALMLLYKFVIPHS